jgi:AraC-like DNA-binding protein
MAPTSADRIFMSSLRERLDRAGVDIAVLVREAGIAPQQIIAPDGTLRTAEYFALFRALGASRAMSARTLQRRLHDEGASYQQVLDDVRLRTARRLLSRTQLRAEEIAFLLGFDEFNSFTRAFRTWEGVSPNGWRARRPVRASQQEARV